MDVIIYHNPDCGTSRNTLAMIRNAGIEPHVVEYLKTPPSRALAQATDRADGNFRARSAARERHAVSRAWAWQSEARAMTQLLDAMMAHPILMNRPIVVTPNGVRLCRPSEQVMDLLPPQQR